MIQRSLMALTLILYDYGYLFDDKPINNRLIQQYFGGLRLFLLLDISNGFWGCFSHARHTDHPYIRKIHEIIFKKQRINDVDI